MAIDGTPMKGCIRMSVMKIETQKNIPISISDSSIQGMYKMKIEDDMQLQANERKKTE